MSAADGTPNEAAKPAAPAGPGALSSGQGLRPMRRQDTPRRLKNGIRFRRRESLDALPWPAEAWCALLLHGTGDTAREEGLDYARAGQTAFLQITPAGIEASVQGRMARPYTVRIACETLAPADWDRVVSVMAREAIYSAKLLAGEMPPLIEQSFAAVGRHLVPTDASTITRTCSHCHAEGSHAPCKHIACVSALVIERLAADPLMAFTLRGLDGQRLLERLQEARAIATRGVARAHSTPPAAEQVPEAMPLDRCLDSFWRPGRQIAQLPEETEQSVQHALLRRLGQSPLQGKFPLVGLLASIYDSVAARGRELREREASAPPPAPPADDED